MSTKKIEVPAGIAKLAGALADDEEKRREREAKREQARRKREEREERRKANPPAPVAKLLETYRAWHAAAMALPWLRERVTERPMSIIPYGLAGVELGSYRLGPPWGMEGGGARATLVIAVTPELRFSCWNVGYLAGMSGGRNLTPIESLLKFSPETLDALTRYFEEGVWADLETKMKKLGGTTAATRKKRD